MPPRRWKRRLAGLAAAVVIVGVLCGAGYGFVLKSLPYHTPQFNPPGVRVTAQDVAVLAAYPGRVHAVPVLAWRDVSRRLGSLVTTPASFASELAVLRQDGFQSVSLGTLAALAQGRRVALPARPIALTFDNGLSTDWTTVDPILRRYGFTATAFVDPADVAVKSPSYFLTHDEIQAMAASGRWAFGLELPQRWAAVDAAKAQDELQAITGAPVTAYAWPVALVPSPSVIGAPSLLFPRLRQSFAVVFGRPTTGPATFVAAGKANQSLSRLNITAATTLPELATSLRTGIPSPPPANPLTLPWRAQGGRCVRSGHAVTLKGRRFALCAVVADGSVWRNYWLHLRIRFAPSTDLSAIIELRLSMAGRIEIAIGRSGVSLKQYVGRRWSLLGTATAPRPLAPDGKTLSFLRSGVMDVTLHVTGTLVSARANGVGVQSHLSPAIRSGVIALGFVSRARSQAISFEGLRLTPG